MGLAREIFKGLPGKAQRSILSSFNNTSMDFCLRNLRRQGFLPQYIVDCGAYRGSWTRKAKSIFPDAHVLMIEARAVMNKQLAMVRADFPETVDYQILLLGAEDKNEVNFFEIKSGSSVLPELSNSPRAITYLPMRTLDHVLQDRHIEGISFLKIDVQGYEIEVLKGASHAMRSAEVILLETTLIPYNLGAPLFDEIVGFMESKGFCVYDICGLKRWKEGTLFQWDVFFVRKDSSLRKIDFVYRHPVVPPIS